MKYTVKEGQTADGFGPDQHRIRAEVSSSGADPDRSRLLSFPFFFFLRKLCSIKNVITTVKPKSHHTSVLLAYFHECNF